VSDPHGDVTHHATRGIAYGAFDRAVGRGVGENARRYRYIDKQESDVGDSDEGNQDSGLIVIIVPEAI